MIRETATDANAISLRPDCTLTAARRVTALAVEVAQANVPATVSGVTVPGAQVTLSAWPVALSTTATRRCCSG